MSITQSPPTCGTLPVDAVAALIRNRPLRATAGLQIKVSAVPIRTCYETLTRLRGPREAVLDYAAALFADDATGAARPMPPLALEEAHTEDGGQILVLLLSHGNLTETR
jgi:hypothetical protein